MAKTASKAGRKGKCATKGKAAGRSSKPPLPRRTSAPETSTPGECPSKAEPLKAEAVKAPSTTATGPDAPTAEVTAPPTPKTAGKLSCLDAAAEVLRAEGRPMRVREMVAGMRDRGLWHSDAPTPHQTLASALLREIVKKGPASRFRKADRGQFALAANPA